MPSRLFVGNLSYETTEAELTAHFSAAGPVARVFMPNDRETGRPRGFAFVEFEDPEHAKSAIGMFDQKPFKDRPLVVNEARPSESRPPGPRPGGSRPPSRGPAGPRSGTGPGGPPRGPAPSRGFDDGPPEATRARRVGPSKGKKKGGKRGFWDDGPRKNPIPEKRQSQIFGGVDEVLEEEEVEEVEDVDFDDFATSLPEDEDED
jgi:RNA recognition motif-containing protein